MDYNLLTNPKAATTGIIGAFQILHSAAVFNIGNTYRSGFFRNWRFLIAYLSVFVVLSLILLMVQKIRLCFSEILIQILYRIRTRCLVFFMSIVELEMLCLL
jgi:hypothetical protein